MNTLSMIDVRMEAVRIAIQLKDVTADNVIAIAREIERYIIADAELPEVGTDFYKSLLEKFSDGVSKPNGNCVSMGFASAKPTEEAKP